MLIIAYGTDQSNKLSILDGGGSKDDSTIRVFGLFVTWIMHNHT